MNKQYRAKMDECLSLWKADVAAKDLKLAETAKNLEVALKEKSDMEQKTQAAMDKYNTGITKVSEMSKKLDEMMELTNLEKKKYTASKQVVKNLLEEKKALESKLKDVQANLRSTTDLKLEIEHLKKELNEARIELNKHKMRSIYNGEKIRFVQFSFLPLVEHTSLKVLSDTVFREKALAGKVLSICEPFSSIMFAHAGVCAVLTYLHTLQNFFLFQ